MEYMTMQYPALIYKSKNNTYVANCIIKKIVGFGKSEELAVLNLEKLLNKENTDFPVKVKPVYTFLPNLINAN